MSELITPTIGEKVLDMGGNGKESFPIVSRATDPVILPQPYASPGDFAAQYPTPLDTTEIIAMCEEVTAWQATPVLGTSLRDVTWRELNSLAFTSGSTFISFADGECPEEYQHDGTNTTVTLKNIGAKKSLSISDIMHSAAIAAANWNGINTLIGGVPVGQGVPGGSEMPTFQEEVVMDVKAKEVRLAMTLVLNGADELLLNGSVAGNALEFDGLTVQLNSASAAHSNDNTASGTFSATAFDRFLSESCAKPTQLWGHPQAIQELLSSYFQLGFQGSQIVNYGPGGDRITPGFNFAGFVNTGVGRLAVVADNNFARTDIAGGAFQSDIFALRMTHNGVPLVYRLDQIPLSMNDLVPGCTAIQFQIWAKTAMIVKHKCAHGRYTSQFTGRIVTTCPVIL
jgi:hypothetical protein